MLPSRVSALVDVVAADHDIPRDQMLSADQGRGASHARFDLWWRLRTMMEIAGKPPSFPQIGRWFNRDHSTVVHGVRRWQAHVDHFLPQMEFDFGD